MTPELKREADLLFSVMGMTTADAIHIFLQQAVNSGGLPFQPIARMPNAETRQAMAELEARDGQTFQTTEELFAGWEA